MATEDLSVFVYGTLKPGGRYWPEFCEGKVGEPIPAKIKGELYDLHVGYPGLRLNGGDWVHGTILTFKREEDFLRLDFLEGFEPERPVSENEYNRLKVACYAPSGQALGSFWAYEMTETTMLKLKGSRISSGIWPV